MPRFTVQMTFEAPALPPAIASAIASTRQLPGRASIRLLGSDGLLAVSGTGIKADSADEAAALVLTAVTGEWPKGQGLLRLASWRADPEMVLVTGWRRPGRPGGGWNRNDDDDDDPGGSAGVREPRRPLPAPPSLQVALEDPSR
jgi:hypothetical protein